MNKVMIIGYLGNDPEVKFAPSGDAVATISVATSARWKDKQTGEQKERTEWHRCNAWGKRAEVIGEYLKKGSHVYVEGELQTRKWTDKEGVDRWTTEIRINNFEFLDRKGEGGNRPPHPADQPNQNNNSSAGSAGSQRQQQTDARPAATGQTGEMPDDEFNDDIPF